MKSQNQLKNNKFIQKYGLFNIVFFIISLCLIVPYLFSIRFALPSADDFSMILPTKNSTQNPFIVSIKNAWEFYKNWGGDCSLYFCRHLSLVFINLA